MIRLYQVFNFIINPINSIMLLKRIKRGIHSLHSHNRSSRSSVLSCKVLVIYMKNIPRLIRCSRNINHLLSAIENNIAAHSSSVLPLNHEVEIYDQIDLRKQLCGFLMEFPNQKSFKIIEHSTDNCKSYEVSLDANPCRDISSKTYTLKRG